MRLVSTEHHIQAQRSYISARIAARAVAREDAATFAAMVLRDEQTNRRITLAPVHKRWHELWTEHDRTVFWAHYEAGKTQHAIARVLWELGRNPNLRVAIVSKTARQAQKIMRALAQYITKSEDLKEVFPRLKPAKDLPWNTEQISVEREVISKDPSVQALGIMKGAVMGSRIDIAIVDDALDLENTSSDDKRNATIAWLRAQLFTRMTEDSKMWFVGNAWHPKDAMHQFAREPRFMGFRFPVYDDTSGERVYSWPERWSPERIARELETLGPLEGPRQLFCKAYDDSTARFQKAWLDKCLENGRGYRMVHSVDVLPEGYAIFTGVDLSMGEHPERGDLTSFFTLMLHPDGRRQLLNIESGRWQGPEILARIDDHARRYGGIIIIENNHAQQYIVQFAQRAPRGTIRAFRTGKNKADPLFGVESLAIEMQAGKWIIPSKGGKPLNPEVDAWLQDMLYYDPRSHTGDRLMACWFAREGAASIERSRAPGGGVGVRVLGKERQQLPTAIPGAEHVH
jgi:hypothetical protein